MKSVKFLIPILAMTLVLACKPDKKAELTKLKKQQDQLTEKITALEKEIGSGDTTKTEANAKNVSVLQLKPEVFKHFVEIQGKVDAEENVTIVPEVSGVVNAVNVRIGDNVKVGQVLARIENVASQEQLKGLETQYKFAKETFEKQQRLWDQKIGSEIQYLQAKTAKENLEAQISATNKQLDKFTIKSPINGIVGDALLKVGQLIAPPAVAFRIVNLNSMKVVADVAEAYTVKVSAGDEVQVFFPDMNKEITAHISAASKYINPVNRTFQVEVRLTPGAGDFKANMLAVLKINDYKSANAISIPLNLVQNDNNGSFVFVAMNHSPAKAKKVYVKIGQTYNGIVEITDGLKAGDMIVTSGQLDLQDGDAIKM